MFNILSKLKKAWRENLERGELIESQREIKGMENRLKNEYGYDVKKERELRLQKNREKDKKY